MNIAAIIVGIDGWEQYTLPLIKSIQKYDPECWIAVIDNGSKEPYPQFDIDNDTCRAMVFQTDRSCYSAAINHGKKIMGDADWTIVLSNDVLCTGPFAATLEQYGGGDLVGPLLKQIHIEQVGTVDYLEGWCVAISRHAWDKIGPWDEGMRISSYEDCDYSHRARRAGFGLSQDLPFKHLDQKQRFYLVPDYWSSEYHNRARFIEKHAVVTTYPAQGELSGSLHIIPQDAQAVTA